MSAAVKSVCLGDIGKTVALRRLLFDKSRRALESPIGVLLKDGRVVLAGVLTALKYEGHQRMKLRIGVSRVMDMGRSLEWRC